MGKDVSHVRYMYNVTISLHHLLISDDTIFFLYSLSKQTFHSSIHPSIDSSVRQTVSQSLRPSVRPSSTDSPIRSLHYSFIFHLIVFLSVNPLHSSVGRTPDYQSLVREIIHETICVHARAGVFVIHSSSKTQQYGRLCS